MVLRLFVVRTVKVRLFFYFGLTLNQHFVEYNKLMIEWLHPKKYNIFPRLLHTLIH